MTQLTICMPSNRGFDASRRSIETALDYCAARDAVLIVADNSGDADKQAHWRGRFPQLRHLDTGGLNAIDNFMAAFRAAETPFILPMGDDDELLIDPSFPAFDLAALPQDHIGVRPVTEVWTADRGVLRRKDFAITAATPAERMLEYNEHAKGDNSAFYSIFRRAAYLDLMDLFTRHHPTRGSYCDWSQVLALFSYGRMALDRSTVFRYNFAGWDKASTLTGKIAAAYTAAGLPADAAKYALLLLYLDSVVFVSSARAPLAREQATNAIAGLSGAFLNGFLAQMQERPDDFSETARYLADLIRDEQNPMGRFQIALVLANQIEEGLKERYIDYYRKAATHIGNS